MPGTGHSSTRHVKADSHDGIATLTIDRPTLSPEDIKKLKIAMHNNSASE